MERSATSRPEHVPAALGFLVEEEQRTLAALQDALVAAGDELLELDEVRAWVRAHPRLAVGAGTALGVLLAPVVARAVRGALPLLSARLMHALPAGDHLASTLLGGLGARKT